MQLETPKQQPSTSQVCEYLWKGVNQLGVLDEASIYCQTKIEQNVAESHFKENSQYQLMQVDSLTESDQKLLEKLGFSIPYLEQLFVDDLDVEESYINSFNQDIKINLARKVEKKLWARWGHPDVTQGINFQQSMVETGYIYATCPFSGTILRSNQSFSLNWVTYVYRFTGKHVFFLFVSGWGGSKRLFYFPHLELVFSRANDSFVTRGNYYKVWINLFKSYVVSRWSLFQYYINSEGKKETAALCAFNSNIGHFFWNDMSGIYNLYENRILHKVDKFIVGLHEYFSVAHIFPEIPPEKLIHAKTGNLDLFTFLLSNNYFCVRVTDLDIKENLANRVRKAARQRCSPDFLQEVELAKQHFPLIWVGCRYRNRVWLSQVEGTANIIKSLYLEFPNLGVVFGGWSPKENEEATPHEAVKLETPIKTFMEQVLALIPPNIPTYKAFGRPNYENIVFCNAIDMFIATFGSETAYLSMIVNKPGIIHTNTSYAWSQIEPMYVDVRENCIPPLLIDHKYIVDHYDPNPMTRNYDCNWQEIYNETIKIVHQLVIHQSQGHSRYASLQNGK